MPGLKGHSGLVHSVAFGRHGRNAGQPDSQADTKKASVRPYASLFDCSRGDDLPLQLRPAEIPFR